VAAYDLGLAAPSPLLAAAAAAALASGGVDDQRDAWLERAGGLVVRLHNSTLTANYALALADSLMERGRMQRALPPTSRRSSWGTNFPLCCWCKGYPFGSPTATTGSAPVTTWTRRQKCPAESSPAPLRAKALSAPH